MNSSSLHFRAAVAPGSIIAQRFSTLARRGTVVAFGVKRAKQYIARKDIQKQAKQEYLKHFYEAADRIEKDHLVFELKPSSPQVRAQQQQRVQHATFNKQLAVQIPQLQDWEQLSTFVQQHAAVLNFLNVTLLAGKAASLCQDQGLADAADHQALMQQLSALILQASSWFQPVHFTAAAVAMASCGVTDPAFWDNLTAAAEHKVGAFTFDQLTQVLYVLATVGFTPHLQWVERSYRQALKHLHVAEAADVCSLMWAWGQMGYTPRDRLFMNQVKIITRRAFDRHELSGKQLVQLMHGIARMPRYAPNTGWLQALSREVQRDVRNVTPGDLVDVMLSLAVLRFQPSEQWVTAATQQLQQGFSQVGFSAEEPLLLDLAALQQQQPGSAGVQAAGVLTDSSNIIELPQLQQMQQLFAEAESGEGLEDDYSDSDSDSDTAAGTDCHKTAAVTAGLEQAVFEGDSQRQDSEVHQAHLLSSVAFTSSSTSGRTEPLTAEQIGILCWCISRLNHRPRFSWMQQLGLQVLQQCPQAPAEFVVDALQGLITVGCLPVGRLQQQLLNRALDTVPVLSPEALVRLCIALSSLADGLKQAPGNDGTYLKQYQEDHKMQLAAAIVHRQGIILWQSSCQQLADVLAYIAATGIKPSTEYLSTAVGRALAKLQEQGASASAVCNLIWALAMLGFKPKPQQLHQLLAALQKGLHLLGSQDLSNVAWGLCTLKHRPGTAWLKLYMQQVAAKAVYMHPQALTDTLWALACFAAEPDREWLKQMVQAVLKQLKTGALSQKNAAVVMWALHQLGFQPQQYAGGVSNDVEQAVNGLLQLVRQPSPALASEYGT